MNSYVHSVNRSSSVISRNQFSLRGTSLSSATWYACVGLGWPLIGYAAWQVGSASGLDLVPAFGTVATLVVVLELLPLVQGRGHDPQGVVMSTAFTAAMLLLWGVWPAIVIIAIGSVIADARVGKQWWKTIFNPGQYALSIAASYCVMLLSGHAESLAHPLKDAHAADLWWIVLVWIVYFVVNLGLVAGVLAWSARFGEIVRQDFWHYAAMTFAVLGLSPLIVILAQESWELTPLLTVPLLLIYYTAQMSLERERAAGHDALTRLPNRTTLRYELDEAFLAHVRESAPFGLMLIDLDDFKTVNDTLGHQVGDELLTKIAHRLQASVRPGDLVARLGGDEFAVVVFDAHLDGVCGVAERIRAGVANSIELESMSVEVQLSLGIALCPDHATDAEALMRHADVAMYRAKANRTGIEIYSPEHDHNSATRLGLIGELRQALDADELELHYQPKVARDRTPMGIEALVRWRHPKHGYIAPDQFIPLAERSGIMPQLTARVVSLAVAQLVQWRNDGINVPVAVNVSPTDLVGDDLPDLVAQKLAQHDLPAGALQFEITERITTHRLEQSNRTLDRLRAMGVTISLDDFGTGYSSLLRLSSMRVDEIKIDRAFVASLNDGSQAVGIAGTLINLAHALGVPAIAEGVETEEQLRKLDELGCDGFQGWHIARPMPSDVATEWIRERMSADAAQRPTTPARALTTDAKRPRDGRGQRSRRAVKDTVSVG
jgi:diguanylate cyclase (GGDEF)-like protein